jgi:hypothetical protein
MDILINTRRGVASRFFSGLKGIHMRILSLLGGLVKGKVLVTVLVSLALVGGTTAVMAATPGGQSVYVHRQSCCHRRDQTGVRLSQRE